MNILEVTPDTYQRLVNLITSFKDTPESVLIKLLDHYEKQHYPKIKSDNPTTNKKPIENYGPEIIPKLRFAKLLDAKFNETEPDKINWNVLVQLALVNVMNECKEVNELRRISNANVVNFQKEDEGYKYVTSHMFSFQGVNAVNAAEIVRRCADFLGCAAYFEFQWRENTQAYDPGARGKVIIPKSEAL